MKVTSADHLAFSVASSADVFLTFGFLFIVAALVISFLMKLRILPPMDFGNRNRRKSDRKFSGHEKKVIKAAQQLIAQGRTIPAAQMLESIGFARESINLLEQHGHIDEAANALLRLQKPDRAGVVYARHGRWEQAKHCFQLADMPLEIARCARECGDNQTAATEFERAQHWADAAESFLELGNLRQAAKNFARAGINERASELYKELVDSDRDLAELDLAEEEIRFLIAQTAQGDSNLAIADLLSHYQKLQDAILELVGNGRIEDASNMYLRSTTDITDDLIEGAKEKPELAKNLADMFYNVSEFKQAAKLYELVGDSAQAAEAYEKAKDYEQAERCYHQVGLNDQLEQLKNKQSQESPNTQTTEPNDGSDHPTQAIDLDFPSMSLQEETVVVNHEAASSTPEDPADLANPNDLVSKTQIRQNRLLHDLSPDEKQQIINIATTREFQSGELMIASDTTPEAIVLILSGSVSSPSSSDFSAQAGDYLGADDVITEELAEHDYTANGAVQACLLEKNQFEALLEKNPTLARKIYKNLLRQLRQRMLTNQNSIGFSQVS